MKYFLAFVIVIYIIMCIFIPIYFIVKSLNNNLNSYRDLTILDIILLILFFPTTLILLLVLLTTAICGLSSTKIWNKLNSKVFKED